MTRPFGGVALGFLLLSWLTTEHILPWVSWHAEVAAFAGIWLLAMAAVGTDLRLRGRGASPIGVPLAVLPLLAFGAIAAVQYATGRIAFGGDLVVVWFYLLLAAVALCIGFRAAEFVPDAGSAAPAPAAWLAWTVLAGACVSTTIAFAQVFEFWIGTGWVVLMPDLRRPGGNLAQPNQLATLLLMGMASALFLARRGRLTAFGCSVVLGYLAIGLAMTESRAGFVGFFAGAAWWWIRRRQLFADVPRAAAAGFAAFYLACYFAWPAYLLSDGASNRLGQPDLRLKLWQQMLEAAWQRPWFGWGVLDVAEAHNAVVDRFAASNALSYAHNLVIDLLVWIGIPLTLLLCGAALYWTVRRLRLPQTPETWYAFALVLPLAVHSMLEFPYAYAYLLVPAALALGFVEGALGSAAWLRFDARAALAALVVASLALAWSVVEYVSIEDDFRVVRFEQLNLGRTPADHEIPDVVMLTQLGALLTGTRVELRTGMSEADLAAVRALAMRYPWLATQFRYVIALALNGQAQEAFRQMQVIRVQRGEPVYRRVRSQFEELGRSRYPQLQGFVLP